MNRWGGKKITAAEREEILRTYLENPDRGSQLAMSHGLSQIYAYKLAHERGLLPITRWPVAQSMTDAIILHLPWPPSVNEANGFGKRGYFPRAVKEAFKRDADALFMTQKRALNGLRIEGPFTYHLVLNRDQRRPLMDGDNRIKYPLDCAQRFGLIENDKLAEGGSWSWGPCEFGAMLSIHPVSNRVPDSITGYAEID